MGTHGSMTKAGKVRKQTPRMPSKNKKNYHPRLKNRVKYLARTEKVAAPARA
jgi:small subunit ribosomal protein S30e